MAWSRKGSNYEIHDLKLHRSFNFEAIALSHCKFLLSAIMVSTTPYAASFDKLYINGAYTPSQSSAFFALRNPKDNTLVASKVPIAGPADVDTAVEFAYAAFQGPWSTFSASQRTACFLKLADLLENRLTDIITLDSLTTGNPVSLIPTREKNYIKTCLVYYGEF